MVRLGWKCYALEIPDLRMVVYKSTEDVTLNREATSRGPFTY